VSDQNDNRTRSFGRLGRTGGVLQWSTMTVAATLLVTAAAFSTEPKAMTPAGKSNVFVAHPLNNEQPELTPQVGTLLLSTGTIDTAQLIDMRTDVPHAFERSHRYLVQLDGPITQERRTQLEEAGIKLGEYIPTFAYFADLSGINPHDLQAAAAGDGELNFIHWVGPWQNEWKLNPEIGQRQYLTEERQALAAQGKSAVIITLFQGAGQRETVLALDQMGATIHWVEPLGDSPEISVTMNSDQVAALATLADVQYVEEAWEITPRNNEARWVVQSNIPGVLPLYDHGLRGEGQIIGIMDTRLDVNHCSFVDPSNPIGPNHRKIVAYNTSFGASQHGTHVSGTAAGDAGSFANTRGMAYNARLVFNLWPSFNETAIYNSFVLHHDQGGRLHSNSWGDDGTTQYNGLCRGIDRFLWDYEESLALWAVTNTSTLKNPENAKNQLAVGATSKAPSQHNHCTGGTGPTSDGRRKPEIYAPGCNTVSSTPGSCSTGGLSGTSMACPAVTGVGTLVRQYFTEGFYPTGIADSGNAFVPTGALIRATLLNSAVDMTGVTGYPSNQEGWGRVLADKALHFLGDDRKLIVFDVRNADGLSTGMVAEESIQVLGSDEKLKITMVFTDVAGAAGAGFAAVNDLDLEVISPTGALYRGNVFSGGVSVPGGNKDDRNNVEQVHVNNPMPGEWTIRVVGAAVNQHTQGYAVAISGDVAVEEPPLTISVPGGVPGLIEPGKSEEFTVRIVPGQEDIVPGSEMLFYRADGGSFQSAPLQHDGGEFYTATLPGFNCDDSPEFYVQAEGDGGTVRTSPPNAPSNSYSADIGVMVTSEVLYEAFGSGLPSGWSANGLWHITSSCAVGENCDGDEWMYYGRSDTCTFNTGSANSGALLSAPITLPTPPAGGTVTVSFCYSLQTENNASYDLAYFSIPGTSINVRMNESPNAWTTFSQDLTNLAGETVNLRWHFDTVDGILNDFRGWQIDAVQIIANGLECEDPKPSCPADLNGDGVVDGADLLILLSDWGTCPGCASDLNSDDVVDGADLLILLSEWGECP
jgi:hypothetical protein